jgi:2-haloalkanoic acid dehalogenase type II
MSKLADFKLLSFDVYGTIIDWERGILAALHPLLLKNNKQDTDPKDILRICHSLESSQQDATPDMLYSKVLTTIHPKLVENLGCEPPTAAESKAFGESIGSFPAFPDSIDALKRLGKFYKLVVLSNVDNDSFEKSRTGSLEGFAFDAVLTAQDIGSYKPNVKNFEFMLQHVEKEFGVQKGQVLQTAQSQFHDHHPS